MNRISSYPLKILCLGDIISQNGEEEDVIHPQQRDEEEERSEERTDDLERECTVQRRQREEGETLMGQISEEEEVGEETLMGFISEEEEESVNQLQRDVLQVQSTAATSSYVRVKIPATEVFTLGLVDSGNTFQNSLIS